MDLRSDGVECSVSPSVHCRAWRRITLPATVSWLPIPDGDPCGPPSDVSALCHVRRALSAIDPSRLLVRVHGTSCLTVHVTLGYCWLLLMPTWRHTYLLQCSRPRRIYDIYDFFAPHINVLTYLLTYLLIWQVTSRSSRTIFSFNCNFIYCLLLMLNRSLAVFFWL